MQDRLARFSLSSLSTLFALSLVGSIINVLSEDAYSKVSFIVGTLMAAACGLVVAALSFPRDRHARLVHVLSRFLTSVVVTSMVLKLGWSVAASAGFGTGDEATAAFTVLSKAISVAVGLFAAITATKDEVTYPVGGWGLRFVVGAAFAFMVLSLFAVVFIVGRVNVAGLEAWLGMLFIVGSGIAYAVLGREKKQQPA